MPINWFKTHLLFVESYSFDDILFSSPSGFAFAGSVLYEIFNEPFGYNDPRRYLHEMLLVMHFAELPPERPLVHRV